MQSPDQTTAGPARAEQLTAAAIGLMTAGPLGALAPEPATVERAQ